LKAVEAFVYWNGTDPEPRVEFEVNYEPQPISLSKACGLVWNCTDILPGGEEQLLSVELGMNTSGTYASAARAMHRWLTENRIQS